MQKKIVWEIEEIDNKNEGRFQAYRVKVIGGWIVETVISDNKLKLLSSTSVFIADRDHEWIIIPPYVESALVKSSTAINPKDFESASI